MLVPNCDVCRKNDKTTVILVELVMRGGRLVIIDNETKGRPDNRVMDCYCSRCKKQWFEKIKSEISPE